MENSRGSTHPHPSAYYPGRYPSHIIPTTDQRFGIAPSNDVQLALFSSQMSPGSLSSGVLPLSSDWSDLLRPLISSEKAQRLESLDRLQREAAARRAANPDKNNTWAGSHVYRGLHGKEGAIIREDIHGSRVTSAGSILTERKASEIYVSCKDGGMNAGQDIQEVFNGVERVEYSRSNYHRAAVGDIHTAEKAKHIVMRNFMSDDNTYGRVLETPVGFSSYTKTDPRGTRTYSASTSSEYHGQGFPDFQNQPRSSSPIPMEENEGEDDGNERVGVDGGSRYGKSQRSSGFKSRVKNVFRTRKTGGTGCD